MQRLLQLKEEIAFWKTEEARLRHHTELAQNLLKVMSEDRLCKEYYSFSGLIIKDGFSYAKRYSRNLLLSKRYPFGHDSSGGVHLEGS
jgi:hypothetical protein